MIAHEVLSDPIKRERYDRLLNAGIVDYRDEEFRKEDQLRREETAAKREGVRETSLVLSVNSSGS